MSPFEHGEVFVLDDGGEADLDLGNYERFLDVTLKRDNNMTTGKVYQVSGVDIALARSTTAALRAHLHCASGRSMAQLVEALVCCAFLLLLLLPRDAGIILLRGRG